MSKKVVPIKGAPSTPATPAELKTSIRSTVADSIEAQVAMLELVALLNAMAKQEKGQAATWEKAGVPYVALHHEGKAEALEEAATLILFELF